MPLATNTDLRRLPDHATFGQLVHVVAQLDEAGHGHSAAECLLRDEHGLRLEADLAPAARPLPTPPAHTTFDDAAQPGSGVSVITTWGNVTGAADDTMLLAFTTISPRAAALPGIALFVTAKGVIVRAPASAKLAKTGPLSADEAGAQLAALQETATVYVTADRDIEARNVFQLLKLVPNRFEVALAVALPRGTRLPSSPHDTAEGICSDGLPLAAAHSMPGELSPSAAQLAVAPLRESALGCALQAGGRAFLGGRLALMLRVGKDGHVHEACFSRDDIHEPLLRRCVISTVKELTFPEPTPGDFADLQVPLQVDLTGPAPQRVSCN